MKTPILTPRRQRRFSGWIRPALALAFAGSLVCGNARAGPGHHHHHHGGHGHAHAGVFIGAPLFWYGPGWHGDPYYRYHGYAPVPAAPPVYVERGAPSAVALWYYCNNPPGYYPYVKQCSTAWRLVVPRTVAP